MTSDHIAYERIPYLSSKDLDYISEASYLRPYYLHTPRLETFSEVISQKKKDVIDREMIYEEISKMYEGIALTTEVTSNIELIKDERTFTIITAHQPSLLTGNLYYIYKIASVINLCQQLRAAYPSYNFVPVFISGGEDHDFEEINNVHLFKKRIEWSSNQTGSVGRMKTQGLDSVMDACRDILGKLPYAEQTMDILSHAVTSAQFYGQVNRQIIHEMFGKYGLLFVDMDNSAFKRAFIPVMQREILERPSQAFVEQTQLELEKEGFKAQAHARDINLFYFSDQGRNRITYDGGQYQVVDTDLSFTEEGILRELKEHPDRFSPNVILRPLYQESIFPNLAYIGGGGEIAYWLERKSQFEAFGITYPMLIRRNSAMLMDHSAQKKMKQLGLSNNDILRDTNELINAHIKRASEQPIELSEEYAALESLWNTIAVKAGHFDPTLKKAALAEMKSQIKAVKSLESRIKRKLKADEETSIKRIESIKSLLMPNNGLQERHDNIFQYYAKYGPSIIDYLVYSLNPLDKYFTIINLE